MAPTKNKKQQPTADFKRIKAKVGRKAKPINETDTSYKAVSIKVAGQQNDTTTTTVGSIKSSRGKSLPTLLSQLQHPAVPVRVSAIKGLLSIVKTQQQQQQQQTISLSLFIPALGPALNDIEWQVRQLGLQYLLALLQQSSNSNALLPFAQLILAFVSSALNSLDVPTRKTGARALAILSMHVPKLVQPYLCDTLLPAMVRILQEQSNTTRVDNDKVKNKDNRKKRKQNSSNSNTMITSNVEDITTLPMLDCFLALLTAVEKQESETDTMDYTPDATDLTFATGGRSRNCILLAQRRISTTPLLKITNIQSLFENNSILSNSNINSSYAIQSATALNMLSVIRNTFIELQQQGTLVDNGFTLPNSTIVHQFAALCRSIRIIWTVFGLGNKEEKQLKAIGLRLTYLLLEVFPIKAPNFTEKAEKINTDICITLLTITNLKILPKDHTECIDKSLLFVQDAIESDDSTMSLTILAQLLLSTDSPCSTKARGQLLKILQAAALADELTSPKFGARAMHIVMRLFKAADSDLVRAETLYGSFTRAALAGMFRYLVAWENKFAQESHLVLHLIMDMARRIDWQSIEVASGDSGTLTIHQLFAQCWIDYLHSIFKSSDKDTASSIFEGYSHTTQELLTNLLLMMQQSLPDSITNSIQSICRRAFCHVDNAVSLTVASALLRDLRLLSEQRSTVNPDFFAKFAIECLNIFAHVKDENDLCKVLDKSDDGVKEVCGLLTTCTDALDTLSIITTFATEAFGKILTRVEEKELNKASFIHQSRTIISIWVFMKSFCTNHGLPIATIDQNTVNVFSRVCWCLFRWMPNPEESQLLWSPLLCLLSTESLLLVEVFNQTNVNGTALIESEHKHCLSNILHVIQLSKLRTVVSRESSLLRQHGFAIYEQCKNGPLLSIVIQIKGLLEIV